MIDRREILDIAGTFGLRPQIVEKDYVLGWALAGIYQQAALAESWIFKGGTCLKKCYFETYRFSEDLDFTLTDPTHIDRGFLAGVFREVGEWIYERTGIEIPEALQEFEIFENPRGTVSCQGKLSYRGPIAPRSGGLPRIKLDLTPDELLVLRPAKRAIFHDYSDAPAEGIAVLCYAYEEAFAEKIRALGDRARPRDLYDVINLYRYAEARPKSAVLHDVLQHKCAHRGLPVPNLGELEAHRGISRAPGSRCLATSFRPLRLSNPSGAFFPSSLPGSKPALRPPCRPRTGWRQAKPCSGTERCACQSLAGSSRTWKSSALRPPTACAWTSSIGGLSGGSNRIPYGAPVTAISSSTPQGPPMVSTGATASTAYRARGRPGRVSFLDSR